LIDMIYALKVTLNQERNVARMLESKIHSRNIDVKSILAPEVLKGYLFIEAEDKGPVEEAIEGLRHVRSILEGEIDFSEIEHFLEAKPSVTGIEKGDIVELIAGPFKGERAKVIRIDVDKEELTIELIEAIVPIPITVRGDYVRIVQKKG
jgi:transcriptional antiterminator NusG